MAFDVGSVIAHVKADITDFKQGLNQAKSEVNGFSKQVSSSLSAAESSSKKFALAITAGATALAGAIGYGAKIAGDLEAARQGFVALLGSAEKADAVMQRIKVEAAATPFELPGLVKGTQALAAITKDGDKAINVLLDVGKAVAISGKGQNELDRVILNLQQIAATGKVTAMDIRQFQGAIPIFNDIIEASGITVAQLQDADNAAELLFGAFQKAGAEGGIAAEGFTSQAGTFNQLISNMKDNITILSSEIVKQTGIFDGLKGALASINKVLGDQDAIIPKIKGFLEFLKQWGPVIAGAIIGALVPAFIAWAGALWAALVPLLPFIAAGAAIGLVIMGIIAVVKNWGTIMDWINEKISTVLNFISGIWNSAVEWITTAVNNIANGITTGFNAVVEFLTNIGTAIFNVIQIIASPFVWLYSNVVEPIMLLIQAIILRVFYEIFQFLMMITLQIATWLYNSFLLPVYNFFVEVWTAIRDFILVILTFIKDEVILPIFNAIREIVNAVWSWIVARTQEAWNWVKENILQPLNQAKEGVTTIANSIFSFIKGIWNGIVSFLQGIAGSIVEAIVKPFRDAKAKVEEWAQKIKEAAEKINPFHRESPSLVDNVRAGVKAIEDAYTGIGMNLVGPTIQGAGVASSHNNNIIQISLAGAVIGDMRQASDIGEKIGDSIIRKLQKNVRF